MANKLVLKRHKILLNILGPIALPIQKRKYNIDIDKFDNKEGEQYLILMNHQTAGDQFFLYMAFNGPIYIVASEDIFTNGIVSDIISYCFGPIPIKKNMTDVRAVKQCLRVAKEGGSIALAPEGNRTYSGETGYMNPAITKLCKSLKMPIALFRIEGGYGKMPRWSDEVREGKMHAEVVKVIYPDEYQAMSDEELLKTIEKYLYVNEAIDNTKDFYSKKSAEFVERFLYTCPDCGLTTIESNNDIITCKKCNKNIRYLKNKELIGENFDFKFKNLKEWYDYQENFILSSDLNKMYPNGEAIFTDNIKFINVIPYKKKVILDKEAVSKLYSDRIEVNYNNKQLVMYFSDISTVSCVDRNKLNVYYKDDVYQFKGDKRFNPLKYMNFYYKKQHEIKGEKDDKFLGL